MFLYVEAVGVLRLLDSSLNRITKSLDRPISPGMISLMMRLYQLRT